MVIRAESCKQIDVSTSHQTHPVVLIDDMTLGTADVADTPWLLCLSSAAVRGRQSHAYSNVWSRRSRVNHNVHVKNLIITTVFTNSLSKFRIRLRRYILKPGHLHLHSHLPSAGPVSLADPAPTLL